MKSMAPIKAILQHSGRSVATTIFAAAHISMGMSSAFAVDTLQVETVEPLLDAANWQHYDRGGQGYGAICALEDRERRIWAAVGNEIQRYDGYRWETVRVCADQVACASAMVQTTDGAVWFGAASGRVARYADGVWEEQLLSPGVGSRSLVSSIVERRDGTLWAGVYCQSPTCPGAGLYRLADGVWQPVDLPGTAPRPEIHSLRQTRDGALLIGTGGNGAYRLDEDGWRHFSAADGLAGNTVLDLIEAADGSLWFACGLHGFARLDGTRWESYPLPTGDRHPSYQALWQSPDGAIWCATREALLRYDGRRWHHYAVGEIGIEQCSNGLRARDGSVWMYGAGSQTLHRYTDPPWRAFGHADGLGGGYEAADGALWFHTRHDAVRYLDGIWLRYGAEDGFLDGGVYDLHQTTDRTLWFAGTHGGQGAVARRMGDGWELLTAAQGMVDTVFTEFAAGDRQTIRQAADGTVWFAGSYAGAAAVTRMDASGKMTRFTSASGLTGRTANQLWVQADGTVWAATAENINIGHGLFHWDGSRWRREPELDDVLITGMAEWPSGVLWVGTERGVSRGAPDDSGQVLWQHYADLPGERPKVMAFATTAEALWFGFLPNRRAGVMRYDGQEWTHFGEAEGLADAGVTSIVQAADGAMWFVGRGGVTRYDGQRWVRYRQQDGLRLGWLFPEMRQMSHGSMWIDCSVADRAIELNRVVRLRHRPDTDAPETYLAAAPAVVSSDGILSLQWSARDRWDKTLPRDLVCQWRLDDTEWSPRSAQTELTLTGLAHGEHRFEVRAIDADDNADPRPAAHAFRVETPWWRNPWMLALTSGLLGLVMLQTARVVQRDRRLRREQGLRLEAQQQLLNELEEELQTAHRLQLGLMPTDAPRLPGLDVQGRCLPANHVGGDFYQYFVLGDGTLSLSLADVTGHAMEAAIPAVMFSGILDKQMEIPSSLAERVAGLNGSLCRSLAGGTFVCLSMADIDVGTRIARLSNAACPYPLHFRAATGTITECEMDAYPLGVRPNATYEVRELELAEGDYLVLHSDGFSEAIDADDVMFGFDRTLEVVRQGCAEGLSSAELIDRLISEVKAFAGDVPQSDDMTCVVVRVGSHG